MTEPKHVFHELRSIGCEVEKSEALYICQMIRRIGAKRSSRKALNWSPRSERAASTPNRLAIYSDLWRRRSAENFWTGAVSSRRIYIMVVPLQNSLALRHAIASMDAMTSCADVDWALRSIDIDRHLIDGPPVFLPLDTTARLTEALARRVGEQHLGALIGQRSEYSDLSWYSEFVLTAPTLGEAFQRGTQALPTLHPGCHVSLETRDGRLILLFHSEIQNVVGARHIDEFMPMLLIDLGRHFLGPGWLPTWVELPDSSMNGTNALEEIYGVPVVFRPGAAGIAMKLEELAAPNPKSFSAADEVVLRDLPGLLGITPPRSFSDLVVEVLRFQVILGDVSAETIAERLSLGVQTLQRRLRHEGTSFRKLRTEFLMARAADLLTQTDHSVDDIARALGYTETNSFRRAFRTRFGLTPSGFSDDRR